MNLSSDRETDFPNILLIRFNSYRYSVVREVRVIVRSQRFVETLEISFTRAWDEMTAETVRELYGDPESDGDGDDAGIDDREAAAVAAAMAEKTVAVAKLVPAMSNLSGEFLEKPHILLGVVAVCPEVHAFTREIW
jgi:hypothetical protein